MLTSFIEKNVPCPACGHTSLIFSYEPTMAVYGEPDIITIENIDQAIDDVFSEILILDCESCGAQVRGTFKELEHKARKSFAEIIRAGIVRKIVNVPTSRSPDKRTLIYCGKCGGYDGKGSCTLDIFNKCDLKRMPLL